MTDGRRLLQRLDEIKAERQERARALERLSQPDWREPVARRIIQGLVILFALYAVYAALRCTWDPSCPIYPTLPATAL